MKYFRHGGSQLLAVLVPTLLAIAFIMSCGGGNQSSQSATGSAITSLTDPPTCTFAFDRVWATVTKVRAHISSSAGPNDSGWVDLVDLSSSPKQIDLLSLASPACALTQLGSASGLPVGKYQQIRFYLLDNNATGVTSVTHVDGTMVNSCGPNDTTGPFNCVVPTGGGPQTLQLSSEVQTGIKIPPGQIAGGGITIQASQTADISIDFNACVSIVKDGSGFRLKPTLTAGQVSLNQNAISGTVVDSANMNAPVPGATVLLEQPDPNDSTMETVMRAGMTDANGSFIFCPLPAGNYDVVAAASVTNGAVTTTYNATVAFAVPVGTPLTNLPLFPESATPTGPATISGQVTSAGTSGGVAADIALLALQQATPTGGSAIQVIIPVFETTSEPPHVTTAATANNSPPAPACPPGTDCFNYALNVPASNPEVSTFSSGSLPPPTPQPASGPVNYTMKAVAPSCSSSTPSPAMIGPITVTPGTTSPAGATIAFSGCTATP